MKRIAIALLLLAWPAIAADWSGLCTAVTDGDTIKVLTPDKRELKVRLYGIDAPERRQPYGTVAREHLSSLCFRRPVTVKEMGVDRYGRVVGLVEADDLPVNREMIKAGLAWVYPQYCRLSECDEWRQLEAEAREAKRGLWGGSEEPIPPWEWRRKK